MSISVQFRPEEVEHVTKPNDADCLYTVYYEVWGTYLNFPGQPHICLGFSVDSPHVDFLLNELMVGNFVEMGLSCDDPSELTEWRPYFIL